MLWLWTTISIKILSWFLTMVQKLNTSKLFGCGISLKFLFLYLFDISFLFFSYANYPIYQRYRVCINISISFISIIDISCRYLFQYSFIIKIVETLFEQSRFPLDSVRMCVQVNGLWTTITSQLIWLIRMLSPFIDV